MAVLCPLVRCTVVNCLIVRKSQWGNLRRVVSCALRVCCSGLALTGNNHFSVEVSRSGRGSSIGGRVNFRPFG